MTLAVWQKALIIGLGGAAGANARWFLGEWARGRWGAAFPWGTLLINVAGSFAIGLLGALLLRYGGGQNARLLLGVGFLGAFTTFSTFEAELLELLGEPGRWRDALLYAVGSVLLGLLAVWLGVTLVRLLAGTAGPSA
jgi:CrcB protein